MSTFNTIMEKEILRSELENVKGKLRLVLNENEELKDILANIEEDDNDFAVPYNHHGDSNLDVYEFILGVEKERIEITKVENKITILVHGINYNRDAEKDSLVCMDYVEYEKKMFPLIDSQDDKEIATIEVTDEYKDEPKVSYKNGVLYLIFEKKEEIKPKKITIEIK